ncbi:hypothetical protein [Cohnella herbarum]|uniref:Lipoprotein n=1 Tax=Cohnella herbarum TaxID=2728023 RepID=A0A7Z2VF96_9BACL|nr:hypothetical protein [Cohnella herbarum]QJD82136.1 hypothetical protein HH215_02365 [Cohnella herbarum]
MGPAHKKSLIVSIAILSLSLLVGCSQLAEWIDGKGAGQSDQQTAKTALAHQPSPTLPPDVPTDIPILEGAKGISAVRTGDGVTKGDGFYQLSYQLATDFKDTALRYRKVLADNKYNYEDEPVTDSVSLTGSTASWIFYITIAKSSKMPGESSVTISYTK